MAVIQKAKETMTAKERVLKTFNFEKTDRVTIGYEANPVIHGKLLQALSVTAEELPYALGMDYRGVQAPYVGKMLFEELPDRRTDVLDGFHVRYVKNESGGYWDFCDFPLEGADSEQIYNYPVVNPDDFDYSVVSDKISAFKDFAICIGGPGMPDIINSMGRIMGMEDILCNLMLEDEATLSLVRRRADSYAQMLERTLEYNKGKIDFMWLGEDLGTQNTPMISLELYRKILKPIHKQFVDIAKAYNIPAMFHTCGSSSWAYEDFIEIGVRGVDTLQPEAHNMSPRYLKEHFGGRLTFRGCISTAGPLAYGTAGETDRVCKETLEVMMDGYGYHFAPTHQIQDNTPPENIIAMYQAAHKYGVY